MYPILRVLEENRSAVHTHLQKVTLRAQNVSSCHLGSLGYAACRVGKCEFKASFQKKKTLSSERGKAAQSPFGHQTHFFGGEGDLGLNSGLHI
jgi:hypothetical protein